MFVGLVIYYYPKEIKEILIADSPLEIHMPVPYFPKMHAYAILKFTHFPIFLGCLNWC